MALGLRFLILTLTRRTEAAGGHWREIDRAAKTWTIPGTRTKNGRAHVVPLSPQALQVLDMAQTLPGASQDGYLFPSPSDPREHLDPHAVTRAVNRICTRLKLPPASPHDVRRTGATTLTGERYGIRRFIVGKVLGHTSNDGPAVTSIYDRNEYLPDKRLALEAWGRHVAGLMPPDGERAPRPAQAGRRLRLVHSV
nr:site-specific integrase [Phenylobacterium aquaticum]